MRERVQCNHCVSDGFFCCLFVFFLKLIYFCSVPGVSHEGQEIEEDVDDVSVEVQRSKDVLLWAQCQLLVA